MTETYHLSLADILSLHAMLMEKFGREPAPLRSEGLLESAIMRPRMASYYENADLVHQCALLTIGISQAQAFMDGNKRTAFAGCDVFLRLNGYIFSSDPLELAKQLERVAEHKDEAPEEATVQFAYWLRLHVSPLAES